jgi:hypothetical protein
MTEEKTFGFIDEIYVAQPEICNKCSKKREWDTIKECNIDGCPCKNLIDGE